MMDISLQFASDRLKDNEEIVKIAIQNNGFLYDLHLID